MASAQQALLFLRKFVKHGRRVASFAPSSQALSRAATQRLDPTRPQNVVELGAGTGAVTSIALARMHPQGRLLAIELDHDFAAVLRKRCPGAFVVEDDAATLRGHLRARRMSSIDLVISGLPLPSVPSDVTREILATFRELASAHAFFSQLTIMPLVFLPFYRRLFHEVSFQWAFWNFPPAGVYHCRGVRDTFALYLRERGRTSQLRLTPWTSGDLGQRA